MKTSTKVILWALVVASGLGVWQAVEFVGSRPSGVHKAVIVEVSGCGAIDLNLCRTIVDMEGVRLSRGGEYGEEGDTVLVMQVGGGWSVPTPRGMEKYRAEQAALSARGGTE